MGYKKGKEKKLSQSFTTKIERFMSFSGLKTKPDKARKARAKNFRCKGKLGLMHFKG